MDINRVIVSARVRALSVRWVICLLCAFMALAALADTAQAQTSGVALYAVTYVDVAPGSVANSVALFKRLRQAGLHEPGNVEFTVLQETTRPNRFVIFEGWKDRAAFDAHGRAGALAEFQHAVAPLLLGPALQMAPFYAFVTAPARQEQPGPRAVYMVEHMDFWPPFTQTAAPLVMALAKANERMDGAIRYDAYQWRGHHYTVVAIWRSDEAFNASEAADHTREFRKSSEVPGGRIDLYEERLYKPID